MGNNRDSRSKGEQDSSDSRNEAEDSQSSTPGMGDTLKKLFTAGVSAAFMTEESVRGFVSELKLPKETLNLILQGASKSKEQLMDRVGREIVGIISKIDFVKEASRFVEEHKFKISAEIEVTKKDLSRSAQTPEMTNVEPKIDFEMKKK
jgi:hypothetical protein